MKCTQMVVIGIAAALLAANAGAQSITSQRDSSPAPRFHQDTLEIPILVKPPQPPVDPSFVGIWCGMLEPVSPHRGQSKYDCLQFSGERGRVTLDSGLVRTDSARIAVEPVSSVAWADTPDDIVWRAVVHMVQAPAQAMVTRTAHLHLTADRQLIDTITTHIEVTALANNALISTDDTVLWGHFQPTRPEDAEAYRATHQGQSVAAAPGAVPGSH